MRPGGRWSLVRAGDRNPQNKYLFLVSAFTNTSRVPLAAIFTPRFSHDYHLTTKKKTSSRGARQQPRHTAPRILSLTGSERSRDLLRNSISLRHQTHQSQCSCYIGAPTPTRMKRRSLLCCVSAIYTQPEHCVELCVAVLQMMILIETPGGATQ